MSHFEIDKSRRANDISVSEIENQSLFIEKSSSGWRLLDSKSRCWRGKVGLYKGAFNRGSSTFVVKSEKSTIFFEKKWKKKIKNRFFWSLFSIFCRKNFTFWSKNFTFSSRWVGTQKKPKKRLRNHRDSPREWHSYLYTKNRWFSTFCDEKSIFSLTFFIFFDKKSFGFHFFSTKKYLF